MRPDLQPCDIVTPAQAARMLGVTPSTLRTWISRNKDRVQPLGKLGRWLAYDYVQLAEIERDMRRAA